MTHPDRAAVMNEAEKELQRYDDAKAGRPTVHCSDERSMVDIFRDLLALLRQQDEQVDKRWRDAARLLHNGIVGDMNAGAERIDLIEQGAALVSALDDAELALHASSTSETRKT